LKTPQSQVPKTTNLHNHNNKNMKKKTFTKLSNPKNHQSFKNPTPTKKHTQSPNSVCATLCVCLYLSLWYLSEAKQKNRPKKLVPTKM
jgi:hypothetical protein